MKHAGPPWEVVHCVFSVAIGGQEMVILALAEHANRALFAPRVLCLHSAGELAPRFEALGIPVDVLDEPVAAGAALATVAALRRYLRRRRPAILHTHNPTPHQYGAIARMVTDVPVLVHTKHGRNQLLNAKGRFLERLAGQLTDALVPVSLDAADVARTVEHVPANRIRVIRNGIDVREVEPVATHAPGWRAVHVARLNLVKDQETLLRAARIVADQAPAFRLDIVGDGELREPLERLAADLALDRVVTFHGMQRDVRPFLRDADAFVLSSISEGIALTLLEAMAAGLPIVATDVGGNREVVVPGETGFLVPAGDPVALAGAMTALFSDADRMRRFGAAARQRAVAEFSVDTTVAAYEALYLGLLKHVDRTVLQ